MVKKLFLFAILLSLVGYWFVRSKSAPVDSLKSDVADHLRLGASPEDVMHFLDARKVEHSELQRPEAMSIEGRNYVNQPVVVGIERDAWKSPVESESIQLVFVFDEDQKLIRSDIFPIDTSF
jgi:hypothetical protein